MARRRNDGLRANIVSSAYAKFSAEGYESVQMKDIAVVVGISPQLMQHYFPKKEDLLVEVVYSMVFRTISYLGDRPELFECEADEWAHYIWIGSYYRLFYHMLCAGNQGRFRFYREVLYDTRLSKKCLAYLLENIHARADERYFGGASWSSGMGILCATQSSLISESTGAVIDQVTVNTAIDTALSIYFGLCGLEKNEHGTIIDRIDMVITNEVKEDFLAFFNESDPNLPSHDAG